MVTKPTYLLIHSVELQCSPNPHTFDCASSPPPAKVINPAAAPAIESTDVSRSESRRRSRFTPELIPASTATATAPPPLMRGGGGGMPLGALACWTSACLSGKLHRSGNRPVSRHRSSDRTQGGGQVAAIPEACAHRACIAPSRPFPNSCPAGGEHSAWPHPLRRRGPESS